MGLRKRLRVPLVSVGAGAILYVAKLLTVPLVSAMPGVDVQKTLLFGGCTVALLLFLLTGFLFLRGMYKDEIVRSALPVSIYYLIAFLAEQALRASGWSADGLFLPAGMFRYVQELLGFVGFGPALCAAPALLCPLFYAAFGRERPREMDRES